MYYDASADTGNVWHKVRISNNHLCVTSLFSLKDIYNISDVHTRHPGTFALSYDEAKIQ